MLERALRLGTPQVLGGNFDGAEGILLGSHGHGCLDCALDFPVKSPFNKTKGITR
jgi:hypothetical protein